jgi:putative transposase
VIDAFARLIAGWRTAASHSTGLVLDALVMAVTYRARQGANVAGLIHHSDYAEVGVKPRNCGLVLSGRGLLTGFSA